jgi:4a-hydroxytetrahydrobiopterin dehydratase
MSGDEIRALLLELDGWEVIAAHHLRKIYQHKNFRQALAFVNRVGALAETEGHHPDICFGWGHAEISIWTHKIDGLSDNDFILAAKIDTLPGE